MLGKTVSWKKDPFNGRRSRAAADRGEPFFTGECKATCALFSCPKGWKPKPRETLGNTQEGCEM